MTDDNPDYEVIHTRFEGNFTPDNNILDVLRELYENVPLTPESRQRFNEIYKELGTLAVTDDATHNNPAVTAALPYIQRHITIGSYIFYLSNDKETKPHKSISEVIDAFEAERALKNRSTPQE